MAKAITLTQKIQELFTYRRIPELLQIAGIIKESPFVSRIYHLQEMIYHLDQYLETHWDIKPKEAKAKWQQIHDALDGFSIKKKDLRAFTSEIRRYEKYELDLRKKKVPVNRGIGSVYASKSCDVKLIRTLIYRHAPDLKKKIRAKDWKYYDLITEVNDDIHDVFEDCENWNGNRFLISLVVKGKRRTRKLYRNFLDDTGKAARTHFKKRKDPYAAELYKWTRERLLETEKLLQETMDGQNLYLVNHSALAKKLKK